MTRNLETTDGIISLLRDYNIQIVQQKLDCGVRGVATKYKDGYIVVLDESLCFDTLLETLKHEICHIILGHLDDDVMTNRQKEAEVKRVMCKRRPK